MCELLHTSVVVQKMQGALSFWFANRSSFLIGELPLGKLSETVVVHSSPASQALTSRANAVLRRSEPKPKSGERIAKYQEGTSNHVGSCNPGRLRVSYIQAPEQN